MTHLKLIGVLRRMITTMKNHKTYSELIRKPTHDERLQYLMMNAKIGDFTFNGHRSLNQILYKCPDWQRVREKVIIRDNGMDLGIDGYLIGEPIYVHHIEPITIEDILEEKPNVFDLNNLITCSRKTHLQIHFGIPRKEPKIVTERAKNDTCPWR